MSKSTVITITTVTILILMLVVPAASAQVPPDFWSLTGNSGTTPGTHFIGTTDREALELHVEGQRGLRIEPSGRSGSNVNIIGGFNANKANPDVRGATIGGGGDAGGLKNAVTDHFGVIGGGAGNKAGNSNTPRGDAQFATVGGGKSNEAAAEISTIGGGGEVTADFGQGTQSFDGNRVFDIGGTVGGGSGNIAGTDDGNEIGSHFATIAGGLLNTAGGDYAAIGGGDVNVASVHAATVGGGSLNEAHGTHSTVSGGRLNFANNDNDAVGGGEGNIASGGDSTIAGGRDNEASGFRSFIGGGDGNIANTPHTTVGGGESNIASNNGATVSGGSVNVASGHLATIGGGEFNTANGDQSTIGGGANNETDLIYSTVGGGEGNTAVGDRATIGGGRFNEATRFATTISGGNSNIASGRISTIGGGIGNTAFGEVSTIAGGENNIASGELSAIGGGRSNHNTSGDFSTIAGGLNNVASSTLASIGGGGEVNFERVSGEGLEFFSGNRVTDIGGTIGGGSGNLAGDEDGDEQNANYATVAGGLDNAATNRGATVGGGYVNSAEGVESTVSGGVGNVSSANWATVGGGQNNSAEGNYSTIPGGLNNIAAANNSFAAGLVAQIDSEHWGATLFANGNGGGPLNPGSEFLSERPYEFAVRAPGGFRFISGASLVSSTGAGSTKEVPTAGTTDMTWTEASANRLAHVVAAFAPDGLNPIAFDSASSKADTLTGSTLTFSHTVGVNTNPMLIVGTEVETSPTLGCDVASVTYDGVNLTKADSVVVGTFPQCVELWYLINPPAGVHDVVVTWNDVVDNRNGGAISIYNAAQQGPEATATNGAQPANSMTTSITTLTDGAWLVDAIGSGVQNGDFMTGEPGQTERYDVTGVNDSSVVTGCNLPAGSGTFQCTSDVSAKANFLPVDRLDVLNRLSEIPVQSWNYKTQDPSIRHIGPMAQDFYAAFGTGVDDKHIGTIDADGVALAAIQGLHQLVQEKDALIETQSQQLASQVQMIENLEERLTALESKESVNESAEHQPMVLLSNARMLFVLATGLLLVAIALGWRRRIDSESSRQR